MVLLVKMANCHKGGDQDQDHVDVDIGVCVVGQNGLLHREQTLVDVDIVVCVVGQNGLHTSQGTDTC